MAHYEKDVPKTVTNLIEKMLDEDYLNPPGTAEKAVSELLERALKLGKHQDFKSALRFWKNAHAIPEDVIWQWFNGVFKQCAAKKEVKIPPKKTAKNKAVKKVKNEGSNKHKPGHGKKSPDKS